MIEDKVIPIDFEFDLDEAIKVTEEKFKEPRLFTERYILSQLHQAKRRMEMASLHIDELSNIKDRISEGIKYVECGDVATDINNWQNEQYDMLNKAE